jgi:hypothetical protein
VSDSRVKWAAVVAVLVLGLGAGGVLIPLSAGGSNGPVTISVPGAMTVAVHCGGDETTHANGERATLTPDSTHCDIEAPLTASMPLRGQLELTGASKYTCKRDGSGMELECVAGGT